MNNSALTIHQRNGCRVCGANDLLQFLNLPNMPLPVDHKAPGKESDAFIADMPLYWCPQCLMVQTQHDVDLDAYYQDYAYVTSASAFVKQFMEKLSSEVWRRFQFRQGDAVLEIGSGDGLQLEYFKKLGARVLGFEPSKDLVCAAEKRGVQTVAALFDAKTMQQIPKDFRLFQVVMTQYTFDHLPEPVQFLKNISQILDAERGIVLIEVHDFEKMVERNEACLFTHEHATYATAESMAHLFEQAGMRLVATDLISESERRGNSMLVAGVLKTSSIRPLKKFGTPLLEKLRHSEAYRQFAENISRSHARLLEHIRQVKQAGKKVAGYGGAGRGVNTIAIAGITVDELVCVYDQNPKLQGLLMPGSNIPVRDPKELFEHFVDEVIVFNYGYLNEIREFLKPYLAKGGKVTSMLEYLKL